MTKSSGEENHIDSLRELIEIMSQTHEGVFDAQDKEFVKRLLAQTVKLEQERQHRERVQKREDTRQQIQKLEEVLKRRQDILDNVSQRTSLFEDFPAMLEYFQEKQVQLIQTLSTIKQAVKG